MRISGLLQGRKRVAVVCGVATAMLAIGAGGALAVFPNDGVDSYTGCLNLGDSPGGTFANVAVGDAPTKPCGSKQKLVHLSGGDITSVNAGAGLTGGSTNGAATLSLAAGQSLPQTCSGDQVPKWNGSGWSCGNDDDTTYGNGTGLDLSGTTFSVSPSYRLPQTDCNNGEVAKWDGSSWTCAADQNSGGDAYYATDAVLPHGVLSDNVYHIIAFKSLPAGSYTLIARTTWTDQDHYAHLVCALRAFDNVITSASDIVEEHTQDVAFNDEGKYESSITLVGVTTLAVPATVDLACRTADPGIDVFQTALLATKVAGIH